MCDNLVPIVRWLDSRTQALGVPRRLSNFLSGLPIYEGICQPNGGPPPIPLAPGIPNFPVNCDTFGIIRSFSNVSNNPAAPTWIVSETIWNCGDNVGRPIGRPRWRQFTPSTFGYVIDFERADGSGTIELSAGQTTFGDFRERVQIAEIDIDYCPSCSLPPPPPVPPEPPEDDDPPDPEEPPIIIIDIDFPTLPGLPPISFPVSYSPVLNLDIPINVSPNLVLAPRVDLNPNFNFAPNFEFSFGGISIGGGGYSEPRPDVQTIVDCDCPDPCPPGGDVDYDRIARIVSDRLGLIRRIPGVTPAVNLGPSATGAEVEIFLPLGTRGILYSLNLDEYTGGASFASSTERSVFYAAAGWFGYDESRPGGDRLFMNQPSGYLEAPAFASRFTAVCRLGAIVTVTPVISEPPPDP